MQLLTSRHTKHYFISIFIVVSVLFITFTTIIYQNYKQAQRINEWTLYNYEVIRQSRKILLDLVDMETGVRGYLLTKKLHFLEPYESSKATLDAQTSAMWQYTENDETTRGNIDIWLKKIEGFSGLLNKQIAQANSGSISSTNALLEKQRQEMNDLRGLLEGYIKERLETLNFQLANFKAKQENFKFILILGTVLAISGILMATLVILSLLERNTKAEQEAAIVEERFKAVLNGVNDGLYDYSFQNETIYYSASYKKMLGYHEEDGVDTLDLFYKHVHPEDTESALQVARKYRSGEIQDYRNIFRMRNKNGNWLWILSRGVGIHNAKGEMVRLIGTHTDITEEKKREADLQQLNQEMETFTYITSHDLRSPLVNMKGFATEMELAVSRISPIIRSVQAHMKPDDIQKIKHALEEDIPESIHFIKSAVEKMDILTSAVLDLSRIGKREYQFSSIDCNKLVKRCLEALSYELAQKNIDVNCSDLPSIMSDAIALEHVFSNILDNAVKYMDPRRKGLISIYSVDMNSDVIFYVKDNGRGIDEADKDKVFQSFRRARNTTDVRGLGMGMTFVQATLRRLGGAIWFQSKVGEGTIFHFRLPKQQYKKG